MASTIKKHLQELEQCIIRSDYQKALQIIEKDLKKPNLTEESRLSLLSFKSEAYFFLGRVQESLELSDMLFQESEKINSDSLKLKALVFKGANLRFLARFEEAQALTDKGLAIIQTAKHLPEKELNQRKAQLLIWKVDVFVRSGDIEKSLELVEDALKIALKSEYPLVISFAYAQIALFNYWLDNFKNYEKFTAKAMEVAKSAGNKFHIALQKTAIARIKSRSRDYQEAIVLFDEAFVLSKEMGSTLLLSHYTDLASIYIALFQLDKALECLKESLKYSRGIFYLNYLEMGRIYFWKYDLQKAKDYLIKSKKECEEKNDKLILPLILYNLVLLFLELKDYSQSNQHLTSLENLYQETGFVGVKSYYQIAKIRYLIDSGNISGLAQATELLNNILTEAELSSSWRLDLLYSLLEIRIKELKLSTDLTNLKEAQKQAIHLEVEAEEQHNHWVLANAYRLQSQLALVELNAEKAIDLLTKAQSIAEEIDIELLKKNVKEDREKIKQQLTMLRQLQEKKAPLSESIKLVSLENVVKNIKQDAVLEERDEETGKLIEYRKLFVLKL